MKVKLLLLSLAFSMTVFAAPVCEFRPITDSSSGCHDFQFSRALETGDARKVSRMLEENPNLVFACNHSPSDRIDQFSSLAFTICKAGDKKELPEIVELLLKNGADHKCESRILRVTPSLCANNILNREIRKRVLELLKSAQ